MQNDPYMIVGLIGILALVELCRRCVGLPILCVAGVLLVYTFFNLGGTADLKMTLYQVIRTMFYTFNGIFGGPISVCAKFIVVFIIFGASWSGPASPSSSSTWPTPWPAPPPAAPPRWRSSPPPCAAWCPAPPWATLSPPAPSPSP